MSDDFDYAEDEFDRLADKSPSGVHRRPEPGWRKLLPFALVLVLAPLLAWGAVLVIAGTGSSASHSSQVHKKAAPESSKPKETPKSTPSAAPQTPKTPAVSDQQRAATKVVVLNVSAAAGTAGKTAQFLKSQGYTDVAADNSPGNQIPGTSVYYAGDAQKALGQDVASKLGIKDVHDNAKLVGQYGAEVVVFVFNGFSAPAS